MKNLDEIRALATEWAKIGDAYDRQSVSAGSNSDSITLARAVLAMLPVVEITVKYVGCSDLDNWRKLTQAVRAFRAGQREGETK